MKTADSIVTKILQLPQTMITLAAKHVQGDEKLCKQYLVELYEQKHNFETMEAAFGASLLDEIYNYCEQEIFKMRTVIVNQLKPSDAGPNMAPLLEEILKKVERLEEPGKAHPHQIQKLVKEILDAKLIDVPSWFKVIKKNVELLKEIESQILFTHWMLARLGNLITKHFGGDEDEIAHIIDTMKSHPNIITNFSDINLIWNE